MIHELYVQVAKLLPKKITECLPALTHSTIYPLDMSCVHLTAFCPTFMASDVYSVFQETQKNKLANFQVFNIINKGVEMTYMYQTDVSLR
jgi:hypothetical protein